jgi:hypothetical protein
MSECPMITQGDFQIIDWTLFAVANLVNILMTGIFLSRPKGLKRVEKGLGIIVVALGIPAAISVLLNVLGKREWWSIVLPLLLVVFLTVELILDYILKLDFRHTSILWPYLLLYYISLWGMIGYAFLIGRNYGFVTLITYFLQLFATGYSYSKVGHG